MLAYLFYSPQGQMIQEILVCVDITQKQFPSCDSKIKVWVLMLRTLIQITADILKKPIQIQFII